MRNVSAISDHDNVIESISSVHMTGYPDRDSRSPLRGVLLLTTAVFFLAAMDASTKYLSAYYEVPLVLAIRYFFNCAMVVILAAPRQGRRLIEARRPGMVLLRGICLVLASLFLCLAFQRMPVAETTAIFFLGPLVVVLLAKPLLGEHISRIGWLAAASGFFGVMLIAHPSGGMDIRGIAFALCGVFAFTAYLLLSRLLASSERATTLLFYTSLVGAVFFGASLPWFHDGPLPTYKEALLFFTMGMTGFIGQYLFTAAFRYAPASLLAPVNYLQLLWASLLGWLVFDHVPDSWSLIGMCTIGSSGMMVALRSRRS